MNLQETADEEKVKNQVLELDYSDTPDLVNDVILGSDFIRYSFYGFTIFGSLAGLISLLTLISKGIF